MEVASLQALDLCAGAGGLSLGLKRAGFDVLGVELDPDACATHRANVGPCVEASIIDYHPPAGERFALVAGGVPCQGYSFAGKRGGSDLWREWLRIGVEADAQALLLENVEGILSWKYEDGWGVVARIEEGLRAHGYEPRRAVLCAADYGVPQLRYRLILVAFRDPRALAAFRWPEPTHAERPAPTLFGPALRPWVTVREALGLGGGRFQVGRREGATGYNGERFLDVDQPSTCVVGSHGNADMLAPSDRPSPTVGTNGNAFNQGNGRVREKIEAALDAVLDRPGPTITCCPDEGPDPKRPSRRPGAVLREAINDVLDRPSACVSAGGGAEPFANANYRRKLCEALSWVDRPAPVIKENSGRAGRATRPSQRPSAELAHQLGEAGLLERPSTTVAADPRLPVAGHHDRQQSGAARLSLEDRAVLQGFPPGFVFHGATAASRDKQVGNAVPAQLAEAVGRSVMRALRAAGR